MECTSASHWFRGYSDPGFLWGILTLTYTYALVQAFSVCVAAVTRSSVAAILCTLLLYATSACVHNSWYAAQQAFERDEVSQETEGSQAESDEYEASKDNLPTWLKALKFTFNSLHYALPKTTDAGLLTKLLRRSIESEQSLVEDETGGLTISQAPNFDENASVSEKRNYDDDVKSFSVRWTLSDDSNLALGTIELTRMNRKHETNPDGSRGERLSRSRTARALSKARASELKERASSTDVSTRKTRVANTYAIGVSWLEESNSRLTRCEEITFGYADFNYRLSSRWDSSGIDEAATKLLMEEFQIGFSFPQLEKIVADDGDRWLQDKMSFTAPLKYNIFFSIGSSLAFALTMLFIAWLALRRINF